MSNWAEQPIRKFRIPKRGEVKPCPRCYAPMKFGECAKHGKPEKP